MIDHVQETTEAHIDPSEQLREESRSCICAVLEGAKWLHVRTQPRQVCASPGPLRYALTANFVRPTRHACRGAGLYMLRCNSKSGRSTWRRVVCKAGHINCVEPMHCKGTTPVTSSSRPPTVRRIRSCQLPSSRSRSSEHQPTHPYDLICRCSLERSSLVVDQIDLGKRVISARSSDM